ncbi:MAG: response regulator [Methyloversatilis discipulorum]|uniref:ATP-binding protein n=1 Tax=Methyloversatilis discipulorum TaxID=1119528 RepID=UPI0026E98FCD|nr:ATP-binding protein [Methyloversatilis discipulorum]MBT9515612.1 response regulator [Methyloversatilis discipulorum]
MSEATHQIFKIRRDYNTWVANETLEDYALRYTPRSFRKWSEWRVANTAFGAVSFLALEAIGGAIALNYGFTNALYAILLVGLITFLTGLPISYCAAKYGVDMDLLTRGAGFGYLGSTITSLVYASFTFIFFAIEAAIMALAFEMYFGLPLAWSYLLCSVVVIPLVIHGVTLISRIQLWTQPLWIVLLVLPYLAVWWQAPHLYSEFTGLSGRSSGSSEFDWIMFGAASTVAISLVVQIGEQVDYLRFLPEKTRENRVRWWASVLIAGPGWVVPGMVKMLGGAFLAFLALQAMVPVDRAVEPTQMYLAGFAYVFDSPAVVLAVTALFVIVSQLKINVTNAYAGSLAWSNFFARLTHSHPGRVVWLVFNVVIALLLMLLGVFEALEHVLGLYANLAIAWVGALVADLVVNKPLGLSPSHIEFKRAHLYEINPVGLGSMLIATVVSVLAYTGWMGDMAQAFSPFISLATAFVTAPLIALATRGRYYLARRSATQWRPGQTVTCHVCENSFESEDMAYCPAYGQPICSLCCTLESRCHDRCKTDASAADQLHAFLNAILPMQLARRVNFRVGHFLVVFLSLTVLLAVIFGVVFYQEAIVSGLYPAARDSLQLTLSKTFALLVLLCAVCAWWIVLGSESRRLAQDESNRQNQLLMREIDAHRKTDLALQKAKDAAESANLAKTRYVTGISHELRTPLNSILGYAQILLRETGGSGSTGKGGGDDTQKRALGTILRSGEHLLGLIDGLLDLARIEAGKLRLDPAPMPLRELLDDLAKMFEPQAARKGLQFRIETTGRLPDYVRVDAKRLRQVLINLLANAVKFTEQGEVVLRIDYRMEVARFEIADTGPGIAADDHARIFMPFERSASGRVIAEPGTGLGLSITRMLTSLMGGELTLESELGRGSTFRLRLYLPEYLSVPTQTRSMRTVIGYEGPRMRVLLVDDDATQRHMLTGMLAPLGFDVDEAASGREALDCVARVRPDVVLLDINMDGMDGWETARRLREFDGAPIPVLMVSANVFENRSELLRTAGCAGFVPKPVMESELLDQLREALDLTWHVDEPADAAPPKAEPAADAPLAALDDEERAALLRLSRLGHVNGIATLLDAISERSEAAREDCRRLRALVDGFDLIRFTQLLQRDAHAL